MAAGSSEIEPCRLSPAGAGADFLLKSPACRSSATPMNGHSRCTSAPHCFSSICFLKQSNTASRYPMQRHITSSSSAASRASSIIYRSAISRGRDFCRTGSLRMQFLNPLVLWGRFGVPPNNWFRGSLEGIAPEELAPLLRWRDMLSWTLLSHVVMQGAAQKRTSAGSTAIAARAQPTLSRNAFKAMLMGLRSFIAASTLPSQRTVWDRYDVDNSYRSEEADAKHQFSCGRWWRWFVPTFSSTLAATPATIQRLQSAQGRDMWLGSISISAHLSVPLKDPRPTIYPSFPCGLTRQTRAPSQGWNQPNGEVFRRARGDAMLALAFIHHFAIAKNVPLDLAVDWIMAMRRSAYRISAQGRPHGATAARRREDIFSTMTRAFSRRNWEAGGSSLANGFRRAADC